MSALENLTYSVLSFQIASRSPKSICQLAILAVENGCLVYENTFLVKPPTKTFSFTYYHGITWDKVKDADTLDTIWQDISKYIEGRKVFVYDVERTAKRLQASLSTYKIDAPACEYIDICSLFVNLDKLSLSYIAKKIGYSNDFINGDSKENIDLYDFIIKKRIQQKSVLIKNIFESSVVTNSNIESPAPKKKNEIPKEAKYLLEEMKPFAELISKLGKGKVAAAMSSFKEGEHFVGITKALYEKVLGIWVFTDRRLLFSEPDKGIFNEWSYDHLGKVRTDMGFLLNTIYFTFSGTEIRIDLDNFKLVYPRLKKYIKPNIIEEDKKTKKMLSKLNVD